MQAVIGILSRFPSVRTLGLMAMYAAALVFSLWMAYEVRFDFAIPTLYARELFFVFLWLIPIKLFALWRFGQFDNLLSYFSTPDLKRIMLALTAGSVVAGVARVFAGVSYAPPRGIVLADYVLSILIVCAMRLLFRYLREQHLAPQSRTNASIRRVGIVGAGDVGALLARELMSKRWLAMQPVAFFDDFRTKHASVHGIPVMGKPESLLDPHLKLAQRLRLEEIIIAMPSAPAKRVGEIMSIVRQTKLNVRTVPAMDQLATGQVKVSALRPVEIQDLLGRPQVHIEADYVSDILSGRVVLVTGGGGSIGSELCRQIAAFKPAKLLLAERSEPHLFFIEQDLLSQHGSVEIVPLVADILDHARMREIFQRYKPEVVFHAAAHKHVPMMERQPAEAIKNNVFGTMHLAQLAIEHCAKRFVFISTDKAINPTSVMGASKRLAEIFLQSLHSAHDAPTKIMAVRFGNVLGSSGSVVPVFTKQIANGGPVKVTHPEVTRYFMTIPEAASLVLQSAAQGKGGEIFVLDMGKPVKIIDLARQMIELSGLRPHEDIEIAITGLRPGEKLYEELSHQGENIAPTHHPKIMRFVSEPLPFNLVKSAIEEFAVCINTVTPDELRAMLKKVIPEYTPFNGAKNGNGNGNGDHLVDKALPPAAPEHPRSDVNVAPVPAEAFMPSGASCS